MASGTAKHGVIRQQIFHRGSYYETALTQHIADIFGSNRAEGAALIMLDGGESSNVSPWWRRPTGLSIGKKNKQTEFHLDRTNSGASTFQRAKENNKMMKVGGLIELITLDSFANQQGWFKPGPSIGFIKIDVEHFEASEAGAEQENEIPPLPATSQALPFLPRPSALTI